MPNATSLFLLRLRSNAIAERCHELSTGALTVGKYHRGKKCRRATTIGAKRMLMTFRETLRLLDRRSIEEEEQGRCNQALCWGRMTAYFCYRYTKIDSLS
jgi:hypothetical protein